MVAGFVVAAVVCIGPEVAHHFDAHPSGGPPQATPLVPTAEAAIILAGTGSQTTDPFYLAGGAYRGDWSAWGEAPEFPPCTHSAELMAVDPANGTTPRGHVADLANAVDVPATGASAAGRVYNLKAGDYYLDVASACSWQIALSPD